MRVLSHFPRRTLPEILQLPDKRLREVSKTIDPTSKEAKRIAQALLSVLRKLDSRFRPFLGMAAPQLGYNKRIVALKMSYGTYEIMVNPEVIKERFFFPVPSACFSVEGVYIIKASLMMKVRYQDLQAITYTKVLFGGKATVMQQEIDHLNGKLVCD